MPNNEPTTEEVFNQLLISTFYVYVAMQSMSPENILSETYSTIKKVCIYCT